MSGEVIPQSVLSESLAEKIAGRRVKVAVFTTYSFDPGFFELHILPLLFDRPFRQVEKVRRIQLEDELRLVEEIAVYYDRTALSQDARPAQLDFRRIDVRRSGEKGVFHPKLILLLVENPDEALEDNDAEPSESLQSLIVGTLSANLTRAGWWENVEAAHFEELHDVRVESDRCSYRKDLLGVIRSVRETAAEGEDHAALDRITEFLRERTNREPVLNNKARERHYTRLYFGQKDLPSWLDDLGLSRGGWNLEIISPYFDMHGVKTLERLLHVLEPAETRVYLPVKADSTAAVTSDFYSAVRNEARWSALPGPVIRTGGRSAGEKTPPRWVHAKVYRMWRRDGQDIVLTGSPNLTSAAHSHQRAGNLEAAFLVDITDSGNLKRWWLEPLDGEPGGFLEKLPDPAGDSQQVFVDITFRFDWSSGKLHYRIEGDAHGPLTVCEPAGPKLFSIEDARANDWIDCCDRAAAELRRLLPSTSLLRVEHSLGAWLVLVREEGMISRPSLLASLTPEEILEYWSLLSPEQRASFIEEGPWLGAGLEGLPVGRPDRQAAYETVFDRFSGVFHAFERLSQHVDRAIRAREFREAEARMLGAKYDSLPMLLQKILEQDGRDPVIAYVTFLSAKQVCREIKEAHPEFWRAQGRNTERLEACLASVPRLRESLPLRDDPGRDAFLEWYETMFDRRIPQPEDAE